MFASPTMDGSADISTDTNEAKKSEEYAMNSPSSLGHEKFNMVNPNQGDFRPSCDLPMATGFGNPFMPWVSTDVNQSIGTPSLPYLTPWASMIEPPYATANAPLWSPLFPATHFPSFQSNANYWPQYQSAIPPLPSSNSALYPSFQSPLPGFGVLPTLSQDYRYPASAAVSQLDEGSATIPVRPYPIRPQPSYAYPCPTFQQAEADVETCSQKETVDPFVVSGRKRARESSSSSASHEPPTTKFKSDSLEPDPADDTDEMFLIKNEPLSSPDNGASTHSSSFQDDLLESSSSAQGISPCQPPSKSKSKNLLVSYVELTVDNPPPRKKTGPKPIPTPAFQRSGSQANLLASYVDPFHSGRQCAPLKETLYKSTDGQPSVEQDDIQAGLQPPSQSTSLLSNVQDRDALAGRTIVNNVAKRAGITGIVTSSSVEDQQAGHSDALEEKKSESIASESGFTRRIKNCTCSSTPCVCQDPLLVQSSSRKRKRRRHACPYPSCGKDFQGKTQLEMHLNVHRDTRPFPCDHNGCSKAFRSKSALKKHTKVHEMEMPFQCPQCDLRFREKQTLAQHMTTHRLGTAIKSYVCKKCGMAFIQKMALENHMQNHLSPEEFQCNYCGRTFKILWRIQQHVRQMHSSKQSSRQNQQTDLPGNSNPGPSSQGPLKSSTQEHLDYSIKRNDVYIKEEEDAEVELEEVSVSDNWATASEDGVYGDNVQEHSEFAVENLSTHQQLAEIELFEVSEPVNLKPAVDGAPCEPSDDDGAECTKTSGNQETTTSSTDPETETEPLDMSLFQENIAEMLQLLLDPGTLRDIGWPESSVDAVLQNILNQCGSKPLDEVEHNMADRLLGNIKQLFSFIIDDQDVLDNLLSHKSVDQLLHQVIQLAKSTDDSPTDTAQQSSI